MNGKPGSGAMCRGFATFLVFGVAGLSGCVTSPPDPERYRLSDSASWRVGAGGDAVLEDLTARYPEFLGIALDPTRTQELDIRVVRADLERETGRQRYDALNAVAIAYFELNFRAQAGLDEDAEGGNYLADSFRASKLLSMPWRAYREVEDPALRDAIVDFYDDIARGAKPHAAETAPRVLEVVRSLEQKETDPDRQRRIHELAEALRAMDRAQRRRGE